MSLTVFLGIALAHFAAAVSPGPAFVVAVRVATANGFAAGAWAAFGFGLGATVWAAGALLGLAVLFEFAPVLLTGLRWVGAAFLLFIGVMMWRHAATPLPAVQAGVQRSWRSALGLGLVTQLANPKPALFFGAVFIGLVPQTATIADKALILFTILVVETAWYALVARVFAMERARATYARVKARADRAFGVLLGGFGIKIAIG